MKRFVLTGAPGSGKTAILTTLAGRGFAVVAEAATDIIEAEQSGGVDAPWNEPGFLTAIVTEQRRRQLEPDAADVSLRVFDRSPVCTLALARYLGRAAPAALVAEIERIERERVYERTVFLIRPIGFIERTAVRRVSFEESLDFERVHEATYLELGYVLVELPPGEIGERATLVEKHIAALR